MLLNKVKKLKQEKKHCRNQKKARLLNEEITKRFEEEICKKVKEALSNPKSKKNERS
jgi:hypothetical protein